MTQVKQFKRPAFEVDPDPYVPAIEKPKKYVPIRQRKVFRELEKDLRRATELWQHIYMRRDLYTPQEEMELLKKVSLAAFQASKFIEERTNKKDQKEVLDGVIVEDKDDGRGNQ
jgi:hypothetical protein